MEEKLKLRGFLHLIAFLFTLCLTIVYIICWSVKNGDVGISIYLLSQLLLFGVSSTYHRRIWQNQTLEHHFRLLDHISIFILISGTQTSVVLTLLPITVYTKYILLTTWTITIAGITKILVLRKLHEIFDLGIYILHGISIVPFFGVIIKHVSLLDCVLFIIGGVVYILGGIVYGVQRPDPSPYVFGYHEVFHAFTIIANYCFFVPLCKRYIRILNTI